MIVTDARALGSLVRQAREEREMTQLEVATLLGVSRQWVVSFEAGAETARLGLALRAVRAVGLELDVVAGEPDPFKELFGE